MANALPNQKSTIGVHQSSIHPLLARLQYGAGLRLSELVRLRVKDVDEGRGIITVCEAKGDRQRTTVLPAALQVEVAEVKMGLRKMFENDRASGLAGVALPGAWRLTLPSTW